MKTGNPNGWLDHDEPEKVAASTDIEQLRYIVITSVDRDDLPDFGAGHYAKIIKAIKARRPDMLVEALTPDFQGDNNCIHTICDSGLHVLAEAKRYRPDLITKSSIMLGLGETDDEMRKTLTDLRKVDVNILTLGQYLQPNKKLLDVVEYVHPDKFDEWGDIAVSEFGFDYCASGPMVRSSYKAAENYILAQKNRLEV